MPEVMGETAGRRKENKPTKQAALPFEYGCGRKLRSCINIYLKSISHC